MEKSKNIGMEMLGLGKHVRSVKKSRLILGLKVFIQIREKCVQEGPSSTQHIRGPGVGGLQELVALVPSRDPRPGFESQYTKT